jgi:hypothetical protein
MEWSKLTTLRIVDGAYQLVSSPSNESIPFISTQLSLFTLSSNFDWMECFACSIGHWLLLSFPNSMASFVFCCSVLPTSVCLVLGVFYEIVPSCDRINAGFQTCDCSCAGVSKCSKPYRTFKITFCLQKSRGCTSMDSKADVHRAILFVSGFNGVNGGLAGIM